MPLRDDWPSGAELVRRIDKTALTGVGRMEIVLVDDGSIQSRGMSDFQGPFAAVDAIRVLQLRRNLGHQRAIAVGLAYVRDASNCDAVVVMDADGEDTPEGLSQLLHEYAEIQGRQAIFAERSRRSESAVFQIFYYIYKVLHRMLTGISVRVGNFSIIPFAHLDTLVVSSELWNHYAATVFRSRLPFSMIPIPRGARIDGVSQMNFVALVAHGLSAISVFADIVGVRLFVGSLIGTLLASLGVAIVVAIRLFTDLAVPGWATYSSGILAIMAIQLLTMAVSFTFVMLSNRTNLGFVPLRDFSLFVKDDSVIYPHE